MRDICEKARNSAGAVPSIYHDDEQRAFVSCWRKKSSQLNFGDYACFENERQKNDRPCEAPFELTQEMDPYPSFLL